MRRCEKSSVRRLPDTRPINSRQVKVPTSTPAKRNSDGCGGSGGLLAAAHIVHFSDQLRPLRFDLRDLVHEPEQLGIEQ